LADPPGAGDERGRIAGPARRMVDRKIDAGDALDRLNDLEHRIAAPVASVKHRALAPGSEVIEGEDMGPRQVADMDVVAQAGAVRRRIIRAEDIEMRALAERRLRRDLDEMRGARAR